MNEQKNKTAFVTGGSKGIGASIVRTLANAGNNVVFTYSSSEEQARKLVEEMEKDGNHVAAVKVDSRDAKRLQSVIENVGQQYGKIDILVNNAGIFQVKDFTQLSPEDFDRMMDINFKGVFLAALFTQPYLPKGGRIISIGSNMADNALGSGMTLYTASKSALQGFTRGLARDLGEKGITVNLVQPGPVNTEMNPEDGELADFMRSRMAIPKHGQPNDIAALVAFLASEEAMYITGSIITIDGGFNA